MITPTLWKNAVRRVNSHDLFQQKKLDLHEWTDFF